MKIFVIDDNDIDLWIAENLIRKVEDKAIIYTFNSIREALIKLAKQEKVDLILLDLHMPIESGLQFLVEYEKYDVKHCPIVILTNSLRTDERKYFMRNFQIVDFIIKPLTITKFKMLLKYIHANS